jgi:predicted N-acetyltransferase YhbS
MNRIMNLEIRQEQVADYEFTENVVKLAFANAEHSDKKEHELVSRIRKFSSFIPELSLVATNKDNGSILGHILLSRIKISKAESLALAPVSVLPEYQNEGIGGSLIYGALKKAKDLGYNSVVVLGHPEYYPRFGFKKASLWGIKAPFEVPDEAFMAIELRDSALRGISGVVEYPGVFFE